MRASLIFLLTAGLTLAAPNGKRQDEGDGTTAAADDPSTTTTASVDLPTVTDTIVVPTLTPVPSFNTSLPVTVPPLNTTSLPVPPNSTVTLPPVITSSAVLPSSSSSVYSRSSRSRRPHTEPIPIFTSKCACEGFSYPCYAYDALNVSPFSFSVLMLVPEAVAEVEAKEGTESSDGDENPLKTWKLTKGKQRCIYEENFSLGCWFQNKGCPSPTRSCAQLFKPTPPPSGKKHPCDLSPPEETVSLPITSASMVITAVPTLSMA